MLRKKLKIFGNGEEKLMADKMQNSPVFRLPSLPRAPQMTFFYFEIKKKLPGSVQPSHQRWTPFPGIGFFMPGIGYFENFPKTCKKAKNFQVLPGKRKKNPIFLQVRVKKSQK